MRKNNKKKSKNKSKTIEFSKKKNYQPNNKSKKNKKTL